MKVLLLSSSDMGGGAARSTYRLHQGLQSINVDSQMLVQSKIGDDFRVTRLKKRLGKLRPIIDALPLQFYRQRDPTVFSTQWLPNSLKTNITQFGPEVINLHWICDGFLSIDNIGKLKQPLVWTLHDMWAFTGGCHYSYDCDRYLYSCGACPQLHSKNEWDLSRWILQRKSKSWQWRNLSIVTPSNWLAQCAKASSLLTNLPIRVIPNGLDLEVYKPIEKLLARRLLNLPQNIKLILFGAISATSDKRKGFHLLQPALQRLGQTQWQYQLEIVIMGASQPASPLEMGFKTHYLGKLSDDVALNLAYSAADVFVAPSTQDNLPNTVLEAIACGLPVVAFNIGGMSDMIEHLSNGYLAKPFDTEDLAQGINWVLTHNDLLEKLSHRAREKAEQEFSQQLQAKRYLSLFEELTSQ